MALRSTTLAQRIFSVLGPAPVLFVAAACGGESRSHGSPDAALAGATGTSAGTAGAGGAAGTAGAGSPSGVAAASAAAGSEAGGTATAGGGTGGVMSLGPYTLGGVTAAPRNCTNPGPGICCDYDFCFTPETANQALGGVGAGGTANAQACPGATQLGFCTAVIPAATVQPEQCCYVVHNGSCCGRPLLIAGEVRLSGLAARGDWCEPGARTGLAVDLSARAREELARAWSADALMEHASIASFARFSLELLALGAPVTLVEAAQQAALDETRHAQLCFALGSRFAGHALGPTPLDLSGLEVGRGLGELAVVVLREGAIGETLAAALARAQLALVGDEQCREVLEVIAADEAEHALLAWRFLRYAVERGGAGVIRRLREALAEPQPLAAVRAASAAPEVLNHYGRLTPEQQSAAVEATWDEVIRPALALLCEAAALPDARGAQLGPSP